MLFQLSSSLFTEIRDARVQADVVNPSTLNRIVEGAVAASTFACRDSLSGNVGFVLRDPEEEDEAEMGGAGRALSSSARSSRKIMELQEILSCLRLGYK